MLAPCKECGSERIAPSLALAGGARGLLGRLRARVCADCGYTELRMDNAMDLFLEHKQQEGAGTKAAPGEDAGPAAQPAAAANIQCPSCGSVLSAAAATCEVCGWSQGR